MTLEDLAKEVELLKNKVEELEYKLVVDHAYRGAQPAQDLTAYFLRKATLDDDVKPKLIHMLDMVSGNEQMTTPFLNALCNNVLNKQPITLEKLKDINEALLFSIVTELKKQAAVAPKDEV